MASHFPLLLLITITLLPSSSSSPLPLPLLSLLSLKSSLVDPSSAALADWSLRHYSHYDVGNASWCSWTGVTCDATTGDVVALDLSRKNLSGSVSPDLRLLYPSLAHLNLSGNSLTGRVPNALFDLRRLRSLDLSHNDFNSTFPDSVSRLRGLVSLDAYSNSFSGPLPRGIARLRSLRYLNLGGSYFTGSIPPGLLGLPRLRYLHLAGNLLTGRLPRAGFANLTELEHLEIGYNAYEGGLPADIGRLAALRYVDVSSANLTGRLPRELGSLPALETIFLFKNRFSGGIPSSFSYLKSLKALDLSDNRLTGRIPPGVSSLKNLTLISLMNNELHGDIPEELGELPNLETVHLWNNSFTGILPRSLGSNGKLVKLDVSSNSLSGPIPENLCRGNRLARLILFSNRFDSGLPIGLANCSSLWRMRIEDNHISGPIPSGFGELPNLTYADFSRNNFTGSLPRDLGFAPKLQFLNLSRNPLGTSLPDSMWSSPSLQIFAASSCGLTGEIPKFDSGCQSLYKLELEDNKFGGNIPGDIVQCQKLLAVKLDRNRLTGPIPVEISSLPSITEVDLSFNELTGAIPPEFDNCSTLESFNLSFNGLSGKIPSSSVLKNLHPSSFAGNPGLCGPLIGAPCSVAAATATTRGSPNTMAITCFAAAAVTVGLVALVIGYRWSRSREQDTGPGPWKLTAFQRLNFTADDVADSMATAGDWILGMGSTGTVYRAEMPGGEIVAVKKLWGSTKKAFRPRKVELALSEVEVLRSVRHRNIVRLLGYCTDRETTVLLYEYLENGSLDDLLHRKKPATGAAGDKYTIDDWGTRHGIALGVAEGVCYLHHDCDPVIVHRDLKPSNILLDGEMEARVADFGLAKHVRGPNQGMSVVAGSYGYIAPEYAYTLQVDEKSDIYSYGVVLMEIVSGRRSVETDFGEGNSIVEWVREKVLKGKAGGAWEVLDPAIVGAAGCREVREEMMLVLQVALLCTSRNPANRPTMRDVVSMLRATKPNKKTAAAAEEQKIGTTPTIIGGV